MDKRILGLFTLMTLAFLTAAIVPVIAATENDNITVSVTVAGTISMTVLTTNGRNATDYNRYQNFTAEMTGGDTSITFDTTEPDERAGIEGLAWDVENSVEVAADEAAEEAGCLGNDQCIDWIVVQNSGDTTIDVAAGTADIDGTADENGDGLNNNDNVLFGESYADYSTRANLYIKCEDESRADTFNLTPALGYYENASLINTTINIDNDGMLEEHPSFATWQLQGGNYTLLTNGSGESGPASGSRVNIAYGLPWTWVDVMVCYLAFETPDNALLRSHSVKVVFYAADDTTGATNDANT